eukprot:SAG11_NODE_958_length_6390_cov_1.884438_2_plen_176_part_00
MDHWMSGRRRPARQFRRAGPASAGDQGADASQLLLAALPVWRAGTAAHLYCAVQCCGVRRAAALCGHLWCAARCRPVWPPVVCCAAPCGRLCVLLAARRTRLPVLCCVGARACDGGEALRVRRSGDADAQGLPVCRTPRAAVARREPVDASRRVRRSAPETLRLLQQRHAAPVDQ